MLILALSNIAMCLCLIVYVSLNMKLHKQNMKLRKQIEDLIK